MISAVNNADFIVINQTVPSALKYGTQKKFSDSGYGFSAEQVIAIFKKIAGVEGRTPVPYIIDFSLMNRSGLVDVRDNNAAFGSHAGNKPFAYLRADLLYNDSGDSGVDQGIGVGQGAAKTFDAAGYWWYGSDLNSYKLYKLLSAIDPATLYGLYFTETDGSYGFDRNLDQYVCGPDKKSDGQGSIYAAGTKLSTWSDEAVKPYYLTTNAGRSIGTIMSKMGWFVPVTSDDNDHTIKNKTVSSFNKVIGGGDGRGLVYNSTTDGLFYAAEAIGRVDLSSYTDIGSKVTISYSGNRYWGSVKIKNTSSNTLSNWKVTFVKDDDFEYTSNNENVGYIEGSNTITLYAKNASASLAGNGGEIDQVIVGKGIDGNRTFTTTTSTSSTGTKLGTIVNSFIASASTKNDYHPYRLLMVSDNLPDTYVNRTVIACIVMLSSSRKRSIAASDCETLNKGY